MEKLLINEDWSFKELLKDNEYERVNIPHAVMLEKLDVYQPKVGIFSYQKTLDIDIDDQRIFIYFEGVMISCRVYLNDVLLAEHFGGYLPFIVDITDVAVQGENKLSVTVDNHDDENTPPGKPTRTLDFLYFGGIYRNVYLIKKPNVYITDAMERSCDDGIKIITLKNGKNYSLDLSVGLCNTTNASKNCTILAEILDSKQVVLSKKSVNITMQAKQKGKSNIMFESLCPLEWSIDEPALYNLKLTLTSEDKVLEEVSQQFGFRSAKVKEDGFYLNDKKVYLMGSNRHQQYPYVGISASDNAQRRDARLLKESGINTLRLAHYPQSNAFLSECDRLGIIVIDCVPGWQFWGNTLWKSRLKENVVDMVRRDRNHPSVMIYEITPNETHCQNKKGDMTIKDLVDTVKSELSTAIVSGDVLGRKNPYALGLDIPHTGKTAQHKLYRKIKKIDNRLPLMREFGDWNFGGNESTSRVSRADGELKMQVQAWNFQWSYNSENQKKDLIGSLSWEAIDHTRGYCPDYAISESGYLDIFRLKKFAYYLFKSQKAPKCESDIVIFPLISSLVNKTKIPVYSNCQRVELLVDGKVVATKSCDNGSTLFYDSKKLGKVNEAYWMTSEDHMQTSVKLCNEAKHAINCLYDGGNCQKLEYPPFTFVNLELVGKTQVTLRGYINDKLVKEYTFEEPSSAVKLAIEVADSNIKLLADDNDFVFVHVHAQDKQGIDDFTFAESVNLTVANGRCIYTDSMNATAGIASFMVRADKGANKIIMTATTGQFKSELTYNL